MGAPTVRQVLFTPWRYAYITGDKEAGAPRVKTSPAETSRPEAPEDTAEEHCFFCAAASSSEEPTRLVVYRTDHHLVMLNRHPYSSGHLMIAPLEHQGSPADATAEASAEFWPLVLHVREVLEQVYAPHGINLGMNLGSAAGAGIADHWHFHLVPRWQGDSNFMGVVGDVRLVPEDPIAARERLRRHFASVSPSREDVEEKNE